jgi:glycosyltransferase involved in cell wall biosynthesis
MAKTWLVSEYYYPVVVTTGYYVTEIAEYLAAKGLDVGIITSNNTYYASDISSNLVEEQWHGVNILRKVHGQISKDDNKKRLLRLLSLSFSFFWMSLRNIRKGDCVIVLTNPAFFLLFMPFVRAVTGCKYHILVHDIFPENLSSLGKVNQKGFVYRLLKLFYDKAYSKADSLISIGRDMSKVLESKIKENSSITLIPNWADVDEVTPMPKENTETYNKIKDFADGHILFQFAGNLGKAQGLDNLMNAISSVSSDEARFLFVGAGAKLEDVNAFAEHNENTISLGFVSRTKQNDFLNACDVGIVTLADGMYGLGVPSKSYNIMATGRPILYIGEDDSEIALCIKEYDIGWVVRPNDPVALKKQIEMIVKERNILAEKGLRARDVAEKVFGKSVVLEQYYQYIKC